MRKRPMSATFAQGYLDQVTTPEVGQAINDAMKAALATSGKNPERADAAFEFSLPRLVEALDDEILDVLLLGLVLVPGRRPGAGGLPAELMEKARAAMPLRYAFLLLATVLVATTQAPKEV